MPSNSGYTTTATSSTSGTLRRSSWSWSRLTSYPRSRAESVSISAHSPQALLPSTPSFGGQYVDDAYLASVLETASDVDRRPGVRSPPRTFRPGLREPAAHTVTLAAIPDPSGTGGPSGVGDNPRVVEGENGADATNEGHRSRSRRPSAPNCRPRMRHSTRLTLRLRQIRTPSSPTSSM